jgi:hypothetical protein
MNYQVQFHVPRLLYFIPRAACCVQPKNGHVAVEDKGFNQQEEKYCRRARTKYKMKFASRGDNLFWRAAKVSAPFCKQSRIYSGDKKRRARGKFIQLTAESSGIA